MEKEKNKKQNSVSVNPFSAMEEFVLNFWDKSKIFEKSVKNFSDSTGKNENLVYSFDDGPPFASGTPHYGHLVASVMKDVVPRYWTMKGYRVERKWGWDCHGLPIENIVEKELGFKTKKEIKEMGVEKFNKICRSKVLGYVEEWEKIIKRLGRWVDMKNAYKTMDLNFMESVWWVFKQLWDKGLIYEDYRSMYVCPRCETTLSQQEIAEGYKMIKDLSVIVKFKLEDEPATFILAWTTTPWTLIGNVALAINEKVDYASVKIVDHESQIAGYYILAKDMVDKILKDKQYEILKIFKGEELIGKKYKSLFNYYSKNKELKNRENGWIIYAGDFVTTEEGTGVVHIAPAFGEDDMNLGKKNNLPFIQHVNIDGTIKKEALDFVGMNVKPIDDTQKTDVEIIKYLTRDKLLFSKEKYEHSYPHCWRCETPLINYATTSWFVAVTKVKDRVLELARKINWSPNHMKEGRFGNWLSGSRDWSISRQRFWASTLPIWKCEKCKERKVVGSINDLKRYLKKSGNKYFLMRHGEAKNNVEHITNNKIETSINYPLTENGKRKIKETATKLKKEKIDIIFSSEFLRTKETAFLVAEFLNIDKNKIIFDKRIKEVKVDTFSDKPSSNYENYFSSFEEKFYKTPPQGENLNDVKNRVGDFIYDIESKYSKKNILIISHEYPIWLMFAAVNGLDEKGAVAIREKKQEFIEKGEMLELNFLLLPHKDNYILDIHRPYIDKVEFDCKCGNKMKRVPDVLDTWFDSGSMPYAQMHYPFENKEKFEAAFPADFIAEGVDQTRAWFYYLHIIGTAIKDSNAFKNVIVNGIVLAEDGKKMSKRLNNYPDPKNIFDKYGADAMRYYLISSPVMAAENLNFSEKDVKESLQKNIMVLWNVYKFYELFEYKQK
ncbi:MAG: class I tRNA ligase family protein, partial [Patescibacteria group bacterium]